MKRNLAALVALLVLCPFLQAAPPKDATPIKTADRPSSWIEKDEIIKAGAGDWIIREDLANTRLHLEYLRPAAEAKASLVLGNGESVLLDGPAGEWQLVDVANEGLGSKPGLLRVWRPGQEVLRKETPALRNGTSQGARFVSTVAQPSGPVAGKTNTPDFDRKTEGTPEEASALRLTASAGVVFRHLWTQPLDSSDHATLIGSWDEASLARGKEIYSQLCVVCHGTLEAPGSLPSALRFAEGQFKNGSDPRSMFETLTKGFGQMVAQRQYTVRETFIRKNPAQFVPVSAAYLANLPVGLATKEAAREVRTCPNISRWISVLPCCGRCRSRPATSPTRGSPFGSMTAPVARAVLRRESHHRESFQLLQTRALPSQRDGERRVGRRQIRLYLTRLDAANLAALQEADSAPFDLGPLTHGGAPRWTGDITTTVVPGEAKGAFAVDTLTLPDVNPWGAWMRTTGFDFYPDGKSAAVCTWNGDVWRVDGLDGAGQLRWHRIVSGLFQPLGVKFRNGELFVCCRDQIARLRNLNHDGETDFIENFNNDHQVTEHFHEFAMGLQTDEEGNFYYAKSARHALPALVPHHGTLLRVSAAGSRTDILANGFRAANGVCVNPDGTFFVTDQEGHWTPKNRINHVIPDGGFYGNMFGYSDVTDAADMAMRQPLVWITNAKDRSPAELVWVPKNVWGPLGGALLNLSYGYGRIYVVPYEPIGGQMQGGVCELPIADFPTGIMRGRFHTDGALYTCGMVGWASNCQREGGFYRLRSTGQPAHLPIAIAARQGAITLTFTDALDANISSSAFSVKAWDLKRSANYGSDHINEHPLAVQSVRLSRDQRILTLTLPSLAPTRCMEIAWKLRDASGAQFTGNIHHTVHTLGGTAEAAR